MKPLCCIFTFPWTLALYWPVPGSATSHLLLQLKRSSYSNNMPPILPAPQRRLLGLIAFLVLSLTVYSALYNLSSQPTPSPSSAVDSLAGEGLLPSEWAEQKDDRGYFASKGNLLNQWSVLLSDLFLLAGSSSGQHECCWVGGRSHSKQRHPNPNPFNL